MGGRHPVRGVAGPAGRARARGHEYLRVSDRGIRAKMGLDATVPYDRRDDFARAPFLDVALGPGESAGACDPALFPD